MDSTSANHPPASRKASPAKQPAVQTMDWASACAAMLIGRRVARQAWTTVDGHADDCVFIHAGIVHLRKSDGTLHTLTLSVGDLEASDWVPVAQTLPFRMPDTVN